MILDRSLHAGRGGGVGRGRGAWLGLGVTLGLGVDVGVAVAVAVGVGLGGTVVVAVAVAVAELLRDPVAAQRRAARAQALPIARAWQESGEREFVNLVEELGSSADH